MELEIKKNISLAAHTTLHIGGVADFLVEVESEEELEAALRFAHANTATPPLILGGGSNILVSDEGYRGLVIVNKIVSREYIEQDEVVLLRVGAGEVFDNVVAEVTAKKLWGLENLSAIPGTVGATPVQNVGAYGVEIASLIESVEAINKKTQEKKTFSKGECGFAYRDSYFKSEEGTEWVITYVLLRLHKEPNPILTYAQLSELNEEKNISPNTVRECVQKIRATKFPDWNVEGTAGSFFKNPIISNEHFAELQREHSEIVGHPVADGRVKVSLGWILDKVCNLKGYQLGNVRLFEKQALVLVVKKDATATEVKKFVDEVSEKVFEKTKIKIEPEVLIL